MVDENKPQGEPAEGFFARWGRRKTQARGEQIVEAAPAAELPAAPEPEAEPELVPAPTHADVEQLTLGSDYARFMSGDVDVGVQRAAMKKLFFTDPHFNLMDGLDTYIDDYNKPDPLPLSMLRQLHQSQALGLFAHEEAQAGQDPTLPPVSLTPVSLPPEPAVAPEVEPASLIHDDDHADLRLQQDDAAGRPGADQGPGS